MKPVRLALLGATGLVGQTTLRVLEEWDVPLHELRLYASDTSTGKKMPFRGESLEVRSLNSESVEGEFAILALSSDLSMQVIPKLIERGLKVVDHSSAFRMSDQAPLVIPEINCDEITGSTKLVANPNCSASIILMALAPLEREFGLHRVIVSTYQSVSGAGASAVEELREQTRNPVAERRVLPHQIAGNLFPEIGALESPGYTGEEAKVIAEIRKILRRPDLHVAATTVRVPVEIGHAASVSVELSADVNLPEVLRSLKSFPGLACDAEGYSTPHMIAGKQDVHVGRVRVDPSDKRWLHFWVVGDNLRKGAASNAIQILQHWATL
ncbi:MAG: aspartate-semialdehyde dehydrogenase [Calditrichaeota bacterium]|nr:aspartate-semialdehyde dehydrogenase [Calditrichota bacterium]MCB9366838.1 aspartate-semialdehyde dehydrogenase [Calditrichota bacterium]